MFEMKKINDCYYNYEHFMQYFSGEMGDHSRY